MADEGASSIANPSHSPLQMHDGDFKKMCHNICNQLRALSGITVPDPHDDLLWLCTILEHGWGDRDSSLHRWIIHGKLLGDPRDTQEGQPSR